MKRRAIKLVVFLLAGAIINVAVAWGCVCRSHFKDPLFSKRFVVLDPRSTLSYDIGVVRTWRTWQAMGITWASPVEVLSALEYQPRVPTWSAFKHGVDQRDAAIVYG